MKTKEKLIIVLLSIVIAGISYWFFWDGYYSIDTYRIISQGYTDTVSYTHLKLPTT